MSPLSFYRASCFTCFDTFLHLFTHSFEARHLDPYLLVIFVCMCWSTLVLLPMPVSTWSSFPLPWAVSPISRSFGKKLVLACFNHSQLLTSKVIQPAHKKFSPSLRHTTNIHHLFGLFCDYLAGHPGRFGNDLGIVCRLGIVLGIVLRGLHLCKSHAHGTV